MKSILIAVAIFLPMTGWAYAQQVSYPEATGYVTDQAGIMEDADHQKIEAWIKELRQKTTAEVAVVTVESTEPLSIEEYAVRLFQRFGIGQKGKDNGVLLLVASKDHHMRIEVGYGLEGAVTDAYSSAIINNIMVPEFKQGQYSDGIAKGTAAIVTLIAKEYNVTLTGVPQPQELTDGSSWVVWLVIALIIFFFIGRGGFFLPMLFFPGGYSRGYGSGGFGGGGGFSGGFGGFGGGMSGGGGASGSW